MEKTNNIDVTVIIPVHELHDTNDQVLFGKALESVRTQTTQPKEILVVCPDSDILVNEINKVAEAAGIKITLLRHNKDTDFCSQINHAVSTIATEYFSILELDDEYSNSYFKNVALYFEAYKADAYLPATVIVDKDNNALHYINEAVWASGFSEKLGFLDSESLLQYNNFIISGGVFKTEAYNEVGGLRGDIKLYFNYEFLLRFTHNDFSIMTIPKLGYKHMFERENSLFVQYKDPTNGIKAEEARFYLDSARKEYFFNPNVIGRNLTYSLAVEE